jgi:two-component system, LuxR family, sensor kinase FixL
LSAIHLCAETAMRWIDRPEPNITEARTQLNRVSNHAKRASAVIKRVRDMTRAAGSRRQPHDLFEIIADALTLVAPQARATQAVLTLEPAGEPLPIVADRIEIEQVVVNLLVNALQAMEGGQSARREVTVTARRLEGEVECVIADTGPGISEADPERLFERFFTTRTDGMGLGLAICRTIVEAHDGRIAIANRNGGAGAYSTLVFPSEPRAGR